MHVTGNARDLLWPAQAKLVPLERLLPHLGPPNEEAAAAAGEARQQLDAAISRIGMTSLTAGGDKVRGCCGARRCRLRGSPCHPSTRRSRCPLL